MQVWQSKLRVFPSFATRKKKLEPVILAYSAEFFGEIGARFNKARKYFFFNFFSPSAHTRSTYQASPGCYQVIQSHLKFMKSRPRAKGSDPIPPLSFIGFSKELKVPQH